MSKPSDIRESLRIIEQRIAERGSLIVERDISRFLVNVLRPWLRINGTRTTDYVDAVLWEGHEPKDKEWLWSD